MAGWNGSGTFTRAYDWTDDAAAGLDIEAARFDTENDAFATGINNCLTKDGQNTPTTDLPMGGQKHTGAASGTSAGDYVILEQLKHQAGTYIADTGAADIYVIAPSPAISAYATGQMFTVKVQFTNTGAATLNVNSKGAKSIKKKHDQALAAGDLEANGIYTFCYDGTNFQLLSPTATPAGAIVGTTDTQTLSGKTLTAPTLTSPTINTAVFGTAFLDEDDMASDSAVKVASQQSIKAYIDNWQTQILIVEDRKATGTDGGTASAGGWNDRELNTVIYNGITSASVSATSGEVTLPAGTYEIEGSAPAYQCNEHQTRLYNVTDAGVVSDAGANDLVGSGACTDNSAAGDSTNSTSHLRSVFTLAAAKVLKLQHFITSSAGTGDLGKASDSGAAEVYAQLRIRKIA